MTRSVPVDRIEAVRRFNRWYTQWVGHPRPAGHPVPASAARVLFGSRTARGTAAELALTSRSTDPTCRDCSAGSKRGLVLRARQSATAGASRSTDARDERVRESIGDRATRCAASAPLAPNVRSACRAIRDRARARRGWRSTSRSRCARTSPATWAGSCRAGALRASTGGRHVRDGRRDLAKFLRLRPSRERAWIAERRRRVGCVFVVTESRRCEAACCCRARRAGSASGAGWSTSASARARSATASSCCGPTTCARRAQAHVDAGFTPSASSAPELRPRAGRADVVPEALED